jgi:hypothetical protein
MKTNIRKARTDAGLLNLFYEAVARLQEKNNEELSLVSFGKNWKTPLLCLLRYYNDDLSYKQSFDYIVRKFSKNKEIFAQFLFPLLEFHKRIVMVLLLSCCEKFGWRLLPNTYAPINLFNQRLQREGKEIDNCPTFAERLVALLHKSSMFQKRVRALSPIAKIQFCLKQKELRIQKFNQMKNAMWIKLTRRNRDYTSLWDYLPNKIQDYIMKLADQAANVELFGEQENYIRVFITAHTASLTRPISGGCCVHNLERFHTTAALKLQQKTERMLTMEAIKTHYMHLIDEKILDCCSVGSYVTERQRRIVLK